MNEELLSPLLRSIAADEEAAFDELFQQVREPLLRMFYRLGRCWNLAEDLLQASCVRLWRYRANFRGQNARAYIYRVALNEWHTHRTREQRQAIALEEYRGMMHERESEPPEARVESEELKHRVRSAVNALPERQRETFVLHRFEGLSCREIAETLGEPRKTVESRLRLALQKLTSRLRREERRA